LWGDFLAALPSEPQVVPHRQRVMFPFARGEIPAGFSVNAQHVVATPLAVDQCRLAVAGDPNSPLCRRAATAWPTRSPRFIRAISSASQMAVSKYLMRIAAISIK
jgi:hypothetical protein